MSEIDPVHGTAAESWGGWHWEPPSRGEHFRRCSYCGSMHPDDLAGEERWHAEWADQKYGWPHKFYVDILNRSPETLFCISHATHDTGGPSYVSAESLTPEQREIIIRDGMGRDKEIAGWYWFETRAYHYGKLYTAHLADPQISDETKERIFRVSGLRFKFPGGFVSWGPYEEEKRT